MARGKVKAIETIEEANLRILHLEAQCKQMREQLARIDPPKIVEASKQAVEDAERIRQANSVMILKLSVATELPRFLRQNGVPANLYLPKLLPILDLDDDWWRKRGNVNLEGWARVIAEFDPNAVAA